MLRLSKLGPGREGYYLQAVAIESPGQWMGHGTEQAGLTSEVGAQELSALLAGRDPISGEVLGSARNRVRVTGFDLTFAAPKSVSLLQGLAEEPVADAVTLSHRAAVAAAVGYVESRALGVRRQRGAERTVERVDGAFGAEFLHRTSRALDPHLHSGREGPQRRGDDKAGDRERREAGRGAPGRAEGGRPACWHRR